MSFPTLGLLALACDALESLEGIRIDITDVINGVAARSELAAVLGYAEGLLENPELHGDEEGEAIVWREGNRLHGRPDYSEVVTVTIPSVVKELHALSC